MSINIESLRKMRNTNFDSITTELEKIVNPQKNNYNNNDEDEGKYWKPTVDKAGNASSVIRFLPKKDGDQLPWVTRYNFGWKNDDNNKWYIELCRSTLGESDPCNEYTYGLRKTGREEDKTLAQKRGRRTNYYSNVLVINDPANPDNNGKVFLYRYGKKIFEKITAVAKPVFEDDKPVNVFDLWEGANFRLVQQQVAGYPNFDKSSFASPTALYDGDEEKLLEVVNIQYQLSDLVSPDKFKSYEELSRKLQSVLNNSSSGPTAIEQTESYVPPVKQESKSNYTTSSTPVAPTSSSSTSSDDEDILKYFESLQND
jgi:hypothetical protein